MVSSFIYLENHESNDRSSLTPAVLGSYIHLNDNLSNQLFALYHRIFNSEVVNVKPIDQLFEIKIGKTPPRKEFQWFSTSDGVKWASIANLGNCGVYLSETTERLTREAINKFNIHVCKPNTVLLSFKLTVGRVAISDCELCTNEAIASFNSKNTDLVAYLYCFLKGFNYETLGSTSSIATAVNSKIIKKIPFPIPQKASLECFNELARPILRKIRASEQENIKLSKLRDALLPKLLNRDLDA